MTVHFRFLGRKELPSCLAAKADAGDGDADDVSTRTNHSADIARTGQRGSAEAKAIEQKYPF